MNVVVTGGFGFIGSNLVRMLSANTSHRIVVIDSLSSQVHDEIDFDLNSWEELGIKAIKEDVRYLKASTDSILTSDVIVHLAAETGTGQSMYMAEKYVDVNCRGTGTLLDLIVSGQSKVRKIILASSRSIYGEGAYLCENHGYVYPQHRLDTDLSAGVWDVRCPTCKLIAESVATPEDAPINCASVYAHTKFSQEELLRIVCAAKGISLVTLRFQNVYGAGQSLKNPYTGILSIFSNRIRQNLDLPLFEDGKMGRDFVYIDDVVDSIRLAIDYEPTGHEVFNIGSGHVVSISEVVHMLLANFDTKSKTYISGEYRKGDVRSCFADISKARRLLGYKPAVILSEGISKFAKWVNNEKVYEDRLEIANREMASRDLMK